MKKGQNTNIIELQYMCGVTSCEDLPSTVAQLDSVLGRSVFGAFGLYPLCIAYARNLRVYKVVGGMQRLNADNAEPREL